MDLISLLIQSHQGVRPRVFRDRANPLTDSDEMEIRAQLRVTKHCFVDLLTTVEQDLKHATDSLGGLAAADTSAQLAIMHCVSTRLDCFWPQPFTLSRRSVRSTSREGNAGDTRNCAVG